MSQNESMRWPVLLMGLLSLGPATAQTVQSSEHAFRVVTIAAGLDQPWSLAFLPDGRMLVTEKRGRLRIVHDRKVESKPIAGVPQVTVQGQGGLMDVALHPRFAETGWVYLSYAARGTDGGIEGFAVVFGKPLAPGQALGIEDFIQLESQIAGTEQRLGHGGLPFFGMDRV